MNFNSNGLVLWEGPSQIDTITPVVALITALRRRSANDKTGDMSQALIMLQNEPPLLSTQTGHDVAVCGSCVHRSTKGRTRTCYVNVGRLTGIWRAYKKGRYRFLNPDTDGPLLQRKPIRIGTWGDPAAIPVDVWLDLLKLAGPNLHTSYTHQWANKHLREDMKRFATFCMASVENETQAKQAASMGFRTFRTRPTFAPLWPGELECPASARSGKMLTCRTCGLCNGNPDGFPANISTEGHGIHYTLITSERIGLL